MLKKKQDSRLMPSSQDMIALNIALEERFISLCGLYQRAKGNLLNIPKGLDKDMYHWRNMAVRHKKGDFRNTDTEKQSIQVIAQWTVDVKAALCMQPSKQVQWNI